MELSGNYMRIYYILIFIIFIILLFSGYTLPVVAKSQFVNEWAEFDDKDQSSGTIFCY